MTTTLRVVPPPTRTRPGAPPPLLAGLRRFVGDVLYGLHAGNAIRHGLPAPRRAGADTPVPRVLRPVR
jgi:hypothetical protein